MATYIFELSQMAQIVLYHRIVNDLIDNEGKDTSIALEMAQEKMDNDGMVAEYYNENNTVNICDILIPLGDNEYTDIFANPENFTEGAASQVAIDWSYLQSDCSHISYSELFTVQEYFTELVSRYPTLANEYRENGIPFLE